MLSTKFIRSVFNQLGERFRSVQRDLMFGFFTSACSKNKDIFFEEVFLKT